MRILLALLALLAAVVVLLPLRASDALDADFRYSGSGSTATLDPAGMSWIQDLRVAGLLYEGLMTTDPRTLQPRPGAAERIDHADGSREFTFHLRADAAWSNGQSLTAADFVYAWRRAIEPGTAADYAFFLEEIDGAAAYVAWRWKESQRLAALAPDQRDAALAAHWAQADELFASTVALQARGPRTLWMRLRRPVAYWLDVVSFAVTYPLHADSVERFRHRTDGGLVYYDEQWAKPGATAYNGPYSLADWRFKRGLRLERNPHYWDRTRYHLQSVAVMDVADDRTAWLMYSGGALDWLPGLETSFAAALATGGRPDIHPLPAFGCYFYNFNCRKQLDDGEPNPFADARVRRAFTLAIDRASLVKHITRRGEPPQNSFIPPGLIPGYPRVDGLSFDAPRARDELASAGFPNGDGFPTVALMYTTDGDHGLIAESVANMWSQVLNVRTRLIGKEVQSFREDKKSQRFMVCRASWYGDYLDPTSFLDVLRRDNGNNDSAYDDPSFDAMLNAADDQPDTRLRHLALSQAESRLVRDTCPILPLFQFVHVSAYHADRLPGFAPNARMVLSLRDVRKSIPAR